MFGQLFLRMELTDLKCSISLSLPFSSPWASGYGPYFLLSFPLHSWTRTISSSRFSFSSPSILFPPFPVLVPRHVNTVSSFLPLNVPWTLRHGHLRLSPFRLRIPPRADYNSTGPLRVYGAGRRVGQSLSSITLFWLPSPSSIPPAGPSSSAASASFPFFIFSSVVSN